jgi:SAM-dependent methyltransferase
MIWTGYLRRYYIERAVRGFNPEGCVLELGSGARWRYYPGSTTVNRDVSAKPDIVCDCENLMLPDESFDSVVALEVIEHTPDPCKFVSEMRRVLAPRGRILVTIPFVLEIHDMQDFHRFTKQGLELLFQDFTAVEIVPHGGKFSVICHFIRLGAIGHFFAPILNNLGYLLDEIFKGDRRITLGYTVTAQKP